jgi:TPR repeat protein
MEGHPKSCHVMSFVYQAGIGVKKDLVESIAWRLVMINAEEEVDSEKYRHNYDALSAEQQAVVEKRAKELCGERNYKSAFARDPAELETERQNYVRMKLKAEAGDVEAQFELSRLLEDGKGTKANDEEAVRWLRRSAEKGFAESQYGLALHLAHGDGVTPDPKEAYVWFRKAAMQGHAYAERAVGLCLQDGEGVKADQAEGKKWILRAADGSVEVIEGDGIVGETPTLPPGGTFSYNSYHLTGTALTAEGAFHGTTADGRRVFKSPFKSTVGSAC